VILPSHTGDLLNYNRQATEPADDGTGRSRGGLTCKLHALVDGNGRPLVVHAGPGQGGDSPMLPVLLAHLRIPRQGSGRPRTRPDRARSVGVGRRSLFRCGARAYASRTSGRRVPAL